MIVLDSTLTLNVSSCPITLGNIKNNGRIITSYKYRTKYLESFFVSIKIQITLLSTLTSQAFAVFLRHKIFLLLLLSCQILTFFYSIKNIFIKVFYLINRDIFQIISYSCSNFYFLLRTDLNSLMITFRNGNVFTKDIKIQINQF